MTVPGTDWLVPAWSGPRRARAFFTTRNGGTSTGASATMDTGPARPSAAEIAGAIGANRQRLRAHLPSDPVWISQVHGCHVVTVDAGNVARWRDTPPEADAAVTRDPDVVLTVRTADCVPVLLAARDGSVLAVAHAGWRGLAGGVLEATLATMAVPTGDVAAWIGPSIGSTAFEVGADVHAAFCDADAACAAHFTWLREGKWLADLPALARARLARGGIDAAGGTWCTYTDADRFYSWRRDRTSGRMALVAWLAR